MARLQLPRGAIALRGFRLDSARHLCSLDGVPVTLTKTEFLLLFTLLVHPGHVFSRSRLASILYPEEIVVNEYAVDSHIKNLRRKLRVVRPDQLVIHCIYGVGYKCDG